MSFQDYIIGRICFCNEDLFEHKVWRFSYFSSGKPGSGITKIYKSYCRDYSYPGSTQAIILLNGFYSTFQNLIHYKQLLLSIKILLSLIFMTPCHNIHDFILLIIKFISSCYHCFIYVGNHSLYQIIGQQLNMRSYPFMNRSRSVIIIPLVAVLWLTSEVYSQQCGANCWKCDSPDLCTNCQTGFYLTSDYSCLSCPLGCSQCYHSNYCIECWEGYVMNKTTQICMKCPENCVKCEINLHNIRCLDCGTGSYPSKLNSVCQPCIQFCLQCKISSGCDICAVGFGYDIVDQRCQACGQNCILCDSSVNSTLTCINCEDSYYLDEENDCMACMQGCLNCTNYQNCLLCDEYYYVMFDNSTGAAHSYCQKCPDSNCITCENTKPQTCTKCIQSAFYDSSVSECIICSDNCKSCISNSQCKTCKDGYYLNDEKKCEICGTACSNCISPHNCTKCQGSYFLTDGQCMTCNYACAQCSAEAQCERCISYEYALSQNDCYYCSTFLPKCMSCVNTTYCIQCQDNFYLYKGQCITNNGGIGSWGIVLIILSIAILLGALIFAIIKKKQSDAAREENGEGPYIQIP